MPVKAASNLPVRVRQTAQLEPASKRILAVNVFESIKLVWLQYHEFNRVLAELESYTDREVISDLRIDRADFARIAYEEAENRVARYRAERPADRASSLPAGGFAAA
jgi:hypothetical protein